MDATTGHRQRGQIVVLFAISALALISMVGLVLDGGSTYAQRRVQQNGADLAALAGANAWLLDTGDDASKAAAAIAMAQAVASQNGYTDGIEDTVVTVTPAAYGAAGAESVKVDIGAQHHNAFGSVVGLPRWEVAVTATAVVGTGGSPRGVAPWMFRVDDFVPGTGEILPQYADPNGYVFGGNQMNNHVPLTPGDLAWTVFDPPQKVNANDVRDIVKGQDQLSRSVAKDQYIGQGNQGNFTSVYNDIHDYLRGQDLTVPIVDVSGAFQGWAMFHVIDAAGGSDKTVTGYFTRGFSENLDVCTVPPCPVSYGGVKVLKLIN
jgi:Flp pilus assembly protein TadG